MKSFIYLPVAMFFIYGCNVHENPKQGETSNGINNTDTTISSIAVPGDTEKEYFLVIQNDTSRFSLFVGSVSSDKVVVKYGPGSGRNVADYPGDSAAVGEGPGPVKESIPKNYSQQMSELALLLNAAAKDFDLRKLSHIRLGMRDIYGLSENVTEQYKAKHSEAIDFQSNQYTCELIKRSAFGSDLNRMLASHRLMVRNVGIDKLVYIKNSRQQTLDGLLILTIQAIQ